jgi:hypothetical protein
MWLRRSRKFPYRIAASVPKSPVGSTSSCRQYRCLMDLCSPDKLVMGYIASHTAKYESVFSLPNVRVFRMWLKFSWRFKAPCDHSGKLYDWCNANRQLNFLQKTMAFEHLVNQLTAHESSQSTKCTITCSSWNESLGYLQTLQGTPAAETDVKGRY